MIAYQQLFGLLHKPSSIVDHVKAILIEFHGIKTLEFKW